MSTKKLSDYEKYRNTAIGGGVMVGMGGAVNLHANHQINKVSRKIGKPILPKHFNAIRAASHGKRLNALGERVAGTVAQSVAAHHVMRIGAAAAIVGGALAYNEHKKAARRNAIY